MNSRFRTLAMIAIAALLVIGMLWLRSCQAERAAKQRAELSRNQTGAAIESGKDAANTVGKRAADDASTDKITRENADAITKAEGASAPVAAPVRDATLASLCRRAAYRNDPKCLQRPAP